MTAQSFRKAMVLKAQTQADLHRHTRHVAAGPRLKRSTFHSHLGGDSGRSSDGPQRTRGSSLRERSNSPSSNWYNMPTEQDGARSLQEQSCSLSRKSESKKSPSVLTRNTATGEFFSASRSRTGTKTSARKSVEMAARSDARSRGIMKPPRERKPRSVAAHDEYIVGDLLDTVVDPEKLEHDKMLADTLRKPHPEEPQHPMLMSPRLPMNIAFTDRSYRIHEGRCANAAVARPHSQANTDWFTSGGSWGGLGKPSSARAGGATSQEVWDQKVCRLERDVKPQLQESEHLNSERVRTAMAHKNGNSAPTAGEEQTLRSRMGGKIRAPDNGFRKTLENGRATLMMQHRPLSPSLRGSDDVRAAGQYNVDIGTGNSSKVRQPFQGSRSVSPDTLRAGVALCISPRMGDPPVPTKITDSRRGDGQFKAGTSAEAEAHSIEVNQCVFRFASPETVRGHKAPAQHYEDQAGKSAAATAKEAERSIGRSPSSQYRTAALNNSASVNMIMDGNTQCEWHKHVRETRLTYEKPFADLCATASTHFQTQRSLMSTVKSLCSSPKLDLSWPGAEN